MVCIRFFLDVLFSLKIVLISSIVSSMHFSLFYHILLMFMNLASLVLVHTPNFFLFRILSNFFSISGLEHFVSSNSFTYIFLAFFRGHSNFL